MNTIQLRADGRARGVAFEIYPTRLEEAVRRFIRKHARIIKAGPTNLAGLAVIVTVCAGLWVMTP